MNKIIYTLTDPRTNQVFYVGAASDPQMRLYRHYWDARNRPTGALHQILLELDRSERRPSIGHCELVSNEEWPAAEQRWIKHYRQAGAPLVNRTAGGRGIVDPVIPTREKMSRSQRGKQHTAEHNAKISEAITGSRNPFFGRQHTDESKAKISIAKQGRPSEKKGRSAPKSCWEGRLKTFILTSANGEELIVPHLAAFCKEQGLSRSMLFGVLAGKYSHHRGWTIRRVE